MPTESLPLALLWQGLYKADRRFGPGIETYPDGCQDVGLWLCEHLLQLCTPVPGAFSMQDHPEFNHFLSCSPGRGSLADEPGAELAADPKQDPFSYAYKRFLLDDGLTLPLDMSVYSTDSGHLPLPRSLRQDLDARIFLGETPTPEGIQEPWPVKNETPVLVQMQRHTYKFRCRHPDAEAGQLISPRPPSCPCPAGAAAAPELGRGSRQAQLLSGLTPPGLPPEAQHLLPASSGSRRAGLGSAREAWREHSGLERHCRAASPGSRPGLGHP